MHALVVFAHPRRDSFTGAVPDRFTAGLGESGEHGVEIADLYREDFECRFQAEDYAQFSGEAMPAAILAEQARVDRVLYVRAGRLARPVARPAGAADRHRRAHEIFDPTLAYTCLPAHGCMHGGNR